MKRGGHRQYSREVPEFGHKEPYQNYIPRPGAYAVLIKESSGVQRLAVVKVRNRYYLPGGGVEAGESTQEALKRELIEETGLKIADLQVVGEANEYVYASEERKFYKKLCTFYDADIVGERRIPTEIDHELEWLRIEDALSGMVHESHIWAVRVAIDNADVVAN